MSHDFSKSLRERVFGFIGMAIAVGWAPLVRADIIPPKNYAVTPGGINVADGSLAYSVTDLSIGTMKLERFYRTSRQQANNPPFGTNFSSNFDIYITAAPRSGTTSPRYPIVHIGNKASGVYTNEHGEKFSYNSKTGKVTQDRPTTGSIIKKSVCTKAGGCGK